MNEDVISKLNPKSFKLKSDPFTQRYGFVAQDVENVIPNLVHTDEDGMMSINYIDIIAHLVHHIQKQDEKISELERLIKNKY